MGGLWIGEFFIVVSVVELPGELPSLHNFCMMGIFWRFSIIIVFVLPPGESDNLTYQSDNFSCATALTLSIGVLWQHQVQYAKYVRPALS